MSVLRLVAMLDAPLVTSDEIHLDDLLASAHPLCRARPVGRETSLAEMVRPPLPICDLRIHRWRVALCTVAQYAPDARLTTIDLVKRRDGADIEALAKPIHLGLGPGKNRWTRSTGIVTPWVAWYCVGQRREVLRLARRLSHVGQMRSAGCGLVRAWEAEYVDKDASCVWVQDGVAQRHLPLGVLTAAQRTEPAAIEPPYWHPGRVVDEVATAGTRVTLDPLYLAEIRRVADPAAARARRQAKELAQAGRRHVPR